MNFGITFNYIVLTAFENFSMANDPQLFLEIENLMYENDMPLFGQEEGSRMEIKEFLDVVGPVIRDHIKREYAPKPPRK